MKSKMGASDSEIRCTDEKSQGDDDTVRLSSLSLHQAEVAENPDWELCRNKLSCDSFHICEASRNCN
jgi:hypothetical protein